MTEISQNSEVRRCSWCLATPEYRDYHDQDWSVPIAEDRELFEKLTLETFQSGLSWRTILEKREGFRRAFHGFDWLRIAQFGAGDVERLLADAGIVRHRGKIEAAINNAALLEALRTEFGSFAAYLWSFEDPQDRSDGLTPRSESAAAKALSADLRRRGWKFVGPRTVYAFMQACGMVNDHAADCDFRAPAEQARRDFHPPQPSA